MFLRPTQTQSCKFPSAHVRKKLCNSATFSATFPFYQHYLPASVQNRLTEITLDFAKYVFKRPNGFKIIPGKKLCSRCFDKIKVSLAGEENKLSLESTPNSQPGGFSSDRSYSNTPTKESRLSVALQAYNISPLKIDNRHASGRNELAKRQLSELNTAVEENLK